MTEDRMGEVVARVRVVNVDHAAGKAGLLALATVELDGGILVRGWRITRGHNGGVKISVPQRTWFDGGERYSEPLIDLPEHLRWEVFDAIRRAYMAGGIGNERRAM